MNEKAKATRKAARVLISFLLRSKRDFKVGYSPHSESIYLEIRMQSTASVFGDPRFRISGHKCNWDGAKGHELIIDSSADIVTQTKDWIKQIFN